MSYRVDIRRVVVRDLKRLPAKDAGRVMPAILALASDPRPPGTKKLKGSIAWRLRVGEYRVIYIIFDRQQLVVVDKVERRTTHTYD